MQIISFSYFYNNIKDSKKDKELQRREGLSNGMILYNNRRTVNSETSDFSDLYYDIISHE